VSEALSPEQVMPRPPQRAARVHQRGESDQPRKLSSLHTLHTTTPKRPV